MGAPAGKRMITVNQLIIVNKQSRWRCKMRMKRTSQSEYIWNSHTARNCRRGNATNWMAQATNYTSLIERIFDQAKRRAVKGLNVPAAEKMVSLF